MVRGKVNGVSCGDAGAHARFTPGDRNFDDSEIRRRAKDTAIRAFFIGKDPNAVLPVVMHKIANASHATWENVSDLPSKTSIRRDVDTRIAPAKVLLMPSPKDLAIARGNQRARRLFASQLMS
jgi:hypothetical protein